VVHVPTKHDLESNIGDPLYRFLAAHNVKFGHVLFALLVINVVRTVVIPYAHHAQLGQSLDSLIRGPKEIQSWLVSFITQPVILYVYWHTVDSIPRIFMELKNNSVINPRDDKVFAEFMHDLYATMTARRYKAYAVLVPLAGLLMFEILYWPTGWGKVYPYDLTQQILIETVYGFILYTMTTWAVGRILLYVDLLRQFWKRFAVNTVPYHHDGAGGLHAIGDFTLQTGLITGALILFFIASGIAAWLVLNHERLVAYTLGGIVTLVFMVIPLAIAAFVVPVWSTHIAMREARDRKANLLARRINLRLKRIYDSESKSDINNARVSELADLIELRKMIVNEIPVWPFSRVTIWRYLLRFLVPLMTPILSPVFIEALKTLLG
jgi:hypothetical protein